MKYLVAMSSDWGPGHAPCRVLKKWVSGFDFKKPGYPGRVSGFQKCIKVAIFGFKQCQIGAFL